MLSFLFQSFSITFVYSAIRFLLSLYFASFFYPADYGILVIPIIIFGFSELILEGGYQASIIRYNANPATVKELALLKRGFTFISWGGVYPFFLAIFNYYFDIEVPIIIILALAVHTLLKVLAFYVEGILVSRGKFIIAESSSFIATILSYLFGYLLLRLSNLSGYQILSLVILIQTSLHFLFLFLIFKFLKHLEVKESNDIANFQFTSRKILSSALIDYPGTKIDELILGSFVSTGFIGLYSKIKEIFLMIGGFTSKVISRPLLYVASNSKISYTTTLWFWQLILASMALLLLFDEINFFINTLLRLLGDNWNSVLGFVNYITILSFLYFLNTISRMVLISFDKTALQLFIDIFLFIFRLVFLWVYLIQLNNLNEVSLSKLFEIEILIRSAGILFQSSSIMVTFIKDRH